MTLSEHLKKGALALAKELKNTDRGWMEAELLLSHVLKKDRTWVLAHGEKKLTTNPAKQFDQLLKRRMKREPIAYLIGTWSFYGREFLTDKRALIPRPETELLIEAVLAFANNLQMRNHLIWDVGCGSGIIGVTLAAELPTTKVVASDISTKALGLAKQNARRLKTKNIRFIKADLLDKTMEGTIKKSQAGHLIAVANLPYLPLSDKKKLDKDVVKYEPASALFTKEDGNFLIHKLMRQLSVFLKKHPMSLTLLAEFDPPQAQKLETLAKGLFKTAAISIHEDLCGRKRVLSIKA